MKNLFDQRYFTRSNDNNFGKYVGEPRTFFVQGSIVSDTEDRRGLGITDSKAKQARQVRAHRRQSGVLALDKIKRRFRQTLFQLERHQMLRPESDPKSRPPTEC